MADEISAPQLSIIVDHTSAPLDFKRLYAHLSSQPPLNSDHHYWHFGGLRYYTIPFQSTDDETTINNVISKLKYLQNQPSLVSPFWISDKKCQQTRTYLPSAEVVKKNLRLRGFHSNNTYQIEYTSGALVQLNRYVYDPQTEIKDGCRLTFYHDRIDLDYGGKENKLRKTFKADLMDKSAVIMEEERRLTLFINMSGNPVEYADLSDDEKKPVEQEKTTEPTVSYRRTAPRQSQPFYSTIRLVISPLHDHLNDDNQLQRLSSHFKEFFVRNYIHDCFGTIRSIPSIKDLSSLSSSPMINENMSFIKQYCWQMLLSIGYRFQQRLTEGFIQHLNLIEDDDESYQTALHIWRRSNEYYFIDLLAELHSYQEKIAAAALLSSSNNTHGRGKKEKSEQERWSIRTPPRHYAYVPSVTLTPTTICAKPLKLVKTNRVLREEQFGGNLMFALVDVKEENGTMELFPHDCM